MDRRSPLVAAIAAMALLVLGSPAAHAEGELAAADSTATITTDAASTVTTTLGDAEATQDVLQDSAPAGGAPEVSAPPPTPAADPIPAADTEAVTPSPTPAAEPEVAAPPDAAAPPAPPAQPEAPTPAEAEAVAPRHATPAGGSTDARPESGSVVSNPVAASAPRQAGIEQILPAVQRDLRGIQEDVEAISRQLAMGAAPPARSLNRLRSRLEALAPVLVALDARSGLGVPSLETRQLLDRVRAQLAETQVSTAGLIAALRRSDLEGPAVHALLSELERFGALGSSSQLGPGVAPFAPTLTPVDPAVYAPVVPAVASVDAPSKRSVPAPKAGDAPEPAGQHAPTPWPSPSESSIASPGGAVSVAGAAALAALLLAFFLPRLLTRLELAPGRSHYVASVLALERPG